MARASYQAPLQHVISWEWDWVWSKWLSLLSLCRNSSNSVQTSNPPNRHTNVLREMLSFIWGRLSQHTCVTSLSEHFILLFKLFQTLLSGVAGDLLASVSSAVVPLVYQRAGLNLPCQAEQCQWQKKGDNVKQSFVGDHLKYCRRVGTRVFFHTFTKKDKWIYRKER